ISFELPMQIPIDIARYAADIFSRIPGEAFDSVEFLAVMHVRVIISLGQWDRACKLMEYYEAKYSALPEDSVFRNHTLGGLYYAWGILRTLICTTDNNYDFDKYYAKQDECLTRSPVSLGLLEAHPLGPWISLVGSAEKGMAAEFIETMARAELHVSHCLNGAMTGAGELARGELLFYQGDLAGAEACILSVLESARENRQYEIVHRALFYTLRISALQGDLAKGQRALKDMEAQLDKYEYPNCFITYDIALTCFYYILNLPEKIPGWLKENFEPYGHAYFIENLGNMAKARYFFISANYPPLLAYIQEMKRRESILFGRLEMLAIEACVLYKMKNKAGAFASLRRAWEEAVPNNIIIPFIELGKDMRTLTGAAAKDKSCPIDRKWLENINRLSASCAKRRSHFAADYHKSESKHSGVTLTSREADILRDLSHGLSRSEIAVSRSLSINTVKMVIANTYGKLGAANLADLIRIATEKKMI
ncbi:MAG: LuxR C-terminal-related transcriptional regulator, partial [Treponema sp.]|nr:LuxR C-terminal-related transcriptional regulator [Treponema sp.]